jgi:hypothetical protein
MHLDENQSESLADNDESTIYGNHYSSNGNLFIDKYECRIEDVGDGTGTYRARYGHPWSDLCTQRDISACCNKGV